MNADKCWVSDVGELMACSGIGVSVSCAPASEAASGHVAGLHGGTLDFSPGESSTGIF